MSKWVKGSTLALLVVGAACSTDTDLSDRPLFDNGVNVFQAQVINAENGTLITDATVKVQVGRNELVAEQKDGFYTVYGIPYGTFRVVVTSGNFNRFQAMKSFRDSSEHDSLADGDPLVYYFNNVVLYPTGTVPGDLTVAVFHGSTGEPLADATVAATLQDITTLVEADDVLAPNVGMLPVTIVAQTDAAGQATLPSGSLILGGRYNVDVFGALEEGLYLVPQMDHSFTVGQAAQEILVFLDRPAIEPVALNANNENNEDVTSLVVTFPYAIDMCTTQDDHGWTNTTNNHGFFTDDTDGDGVTTAPASEDPVVHTLTENDTVLTLDFNTEEDDPGDELYVTFNGVQVKPRGGSDSSCRSLTFVNLRTFNDSAGQTIDTEIHARHVPAP